MEPEADNKAGLCHTPRVSESCSAPLNPRYCMERRSSWGRWSCGWRSSFFCPWPGSVAVAGSRCHLLMQAGPSSLLQTVVRSWALPALPSIDTAMSVWISNMAVLCPTFSGEARAGPGPGDALTAALAAANPLDPFSMPGPLWVGLHGGGAAAAAAVDRAMERETAAELAARESALDAASERFASGPADTAVVCGVCLSSLSKAVVSAQQLSFHCLSLRFHTDCVVFSSFRSLVKVGDGETEATAGTVAECRRLRCGHRFHQVCIDRWLVDCDGQLCPMCRQTAVLAAS